MYGTARAPAIWQREFENILKDTQGVSVFLDDIKMTGPDDNTHLKRLEEVLGRLTNHNIRVNYDKCQFFAEQIEYCGYIIDKFGIHKTKEKMDAIQNAKVFLTKRKSEHLWG
ncbi:Reverse transcriptase (RNA-dependent DNA polymerase) [Popillia japonica]|uniref:Reverse transcriptase (RNA-dependent DNA polymerase) n=1 Tax=Popillia japonica TaxID=7064 RepID=A0AAW1L7W8_POPJA